MTVQSHMQKPTLSVRPDVGLEYTVNVAIFAPTKLPYYIRTPEQKHSYAASVYQPVQFEDLQVRRTRLWIAPLQ